ncbi:unnamed protein product [Periconia digitata]|uniref:Uncharacterized protein n=1 Tax=Periconia digitata TaxID=1303443 RepID=A0A9W4XPW1_9PLEO|nr:unnamed protein product [Periconia digitata]
MSVLARSPTCSTASLGLALREANLTASQPASLPSQPSIHHPVQSSSSLRKKTLLSRASPARAFSVKVVTTARRASRPDQKQSCLLLTYPCSLSLSLASTSRCSRKKPTVSVCLSHFSCVRQIDVLGAGALTRVSEFNTLGLIDSRTFGISMMMTMTMTTAIGMRLILWTEVGWTGRERTVAGVCAYSNLPMTGQQHHTHTRKTWKRH